MMAELSVSTPTRENTVDSNIGKFSVHDPGSTNLDKNEMKKAVGDKQKCIQSQGHPYNNTSYFNFSIFHFLLQFCYQSFLNRRLYRRFRRFTLEILQSRPLQGKIRNIFVSREAFKNFQSGTMPPISFSILKN